MTSEVSHTPGPWKVHHRVPYYVVDESGDKIAHTGASRTDEDCIANSYLIAAAPDLLALAKQYASECAHCNGTGREPTLDSFGNPGETVDCAPCADIRAVINKAEGRV